MLEDDGSILTAGTDHGAFALWQLRPNGAPDAHFGHNGQVVTNVLGGGATAYSLALEGDGSIVVAGGAGGSIAFARYHSNGSLDAAFGNGGTAVVASGAAAAGSSVAGGLVVQPDGKIVAAGASGAAVIALRLNADGSLDTSFGSGGTETLAALAARQDLGEPDHTEGIALQGDGKVLVANRSAGSADFSLVRINTDGSLDATFGAGGVVTTDFGGDDDADAVLVKPGGQILEVGTTDAGGTAQTAVAAFNPDGSPDTSLGDDGRLTVAANITPAPGTLSAQAIHLGDLFLRAFADVAPSGQVVVGTSNESPLGTTSTGLHRLNVAGAGMLGKFGTYGGKIHLLVFKAADGTRVTLSLKGGGTATASYDGDKVDLVLTGTTAKSVLSVRASGGSRRVSLGNVRADGALGAVVAPGSDLSGTLSVNGRLGTVALGSVTGGTIAAASSVGSLLVAGNVSGASVLAGAALGSDGLTGGTGTAADSFSAASIGRLKVGGKVTGSVFAAGVNPGADGAYFTADDRLVPQAAGGTGAADSIGPVVVRGGTDDATGFEAGSFATARLPKLVKPADDNRFHTLT